MQRKVYYQPLVFSDKSLTQDEYMNGSVQFYLSSLLDCTMQNPVELFNKFNQMCKLPIN